MSSKIPQSPSTPSTHNAEAPQQTSSNDGKPIEDSANTWQPAAQLVALKQATDEDAAGAAAAVKGGAKLTEIHVQALDEVVSVNSFFTVAVFIGLSFTNPSAQGSLVSECLAGQDFTKYLLVFEVIAFASYLCSSLIAQGLKLLIVMINSKDHPQPISARIRPKNLKLGMLICATGTVIGTVFLTLSMIMLIQIRLGKLSCESNSWSKWAAIPVIIMVCSGLTSFISTAFYAFLH